MFVIFVLDLVLQYWAKRSAAKNVSEWPILLWVGCETLTQSLSQSLCVGILDGSGVVLLQVSYAGQWSQRSPQVPGIRCGRYTGGCRGTVSRLSLI